jgi:hypothetical protein
MKRRPLSLVVRLTVSIGAVITAVLLTFGWMMERSINNHFVQQDVDELNSVVQALQYLLATVPADIPADELHQRLASVVTGHQVQTRGRHRYRLSSALPGRLSEPPSDCHPCRVLDSSSGNLVRGLPGTRSYSTYQPRDETHQV